MTYDDEDDRCITSGNVLGPDGPRLCSRQCDTCILAPGNKMDLRPGRLYEIIRLTLEAGSFVPCHETIDRPDVQPAICRGFFDAYGLRSNLLRIWSRVGGFHEIEPPGIRALTREEPCDAGDQALPGR